MAGEFNIKNGFKSNGNSTVSGRLTTQKLTITSGATAGYVLTSDVSGNASWASAGGALVYFTETGSTVTPNNTIPVVALIAKSGATNVDIAIVPKGTGAFMLDIPDGTATGGNKRGSGAVDLQHGSRWNGAGAVASGLYSFAAGNANSSTNQYSMSMGYSNTSSALATIAFGNANTVNNTEAIGLGRLNSSTGDKSIAIGSSNTSSNNWSIAMGLSNIASNVGAISLGQLNTASGSNSSALGYGNSNAGGQGCTAIGWSNTITAGASYGAFAVGQQNTVSGQGFAVGVQNNIVNGWALGQTNTVAGGVAIGLSNTANGLNSIAIGRQSSSFSIKSRITYGAGQMSTLGDSQISKFILQSRTTGATTTTLIINYGDSITPFSTNQVVLQNNNAFGFTGVIVAKQSGSTNAAMWRFNGLIVRGANAASTTLVMSEIIPVSNIPGWGGPSFAADTTYGALQVQVVGAALTNLQWTANIETTEVIYA